MPKSDGYHFARTATVVDAADEEEGMPDSGSLLPGLGLIPRSESVEITNDPRIFLDNVVSKRFVAYNTIVTASILMGAISISVILLEMGPEETVVEYIALALNSIAFLQNVLCVVVLTLQYYHVVRLMTLGANGFETCRSYYLEENILKLRHIGTRSFFWSIPVSVLGIGMLVVDRLGGRFFYSLPIAIFLLCIGVLFYLVFSKHASIFQEKYERTKIHEDELQNRGILFSTPRSRVSDRSSSSPPDKERPIKSHVNW